MAVGPSNVLSVPLDHMRTLIASCEAFWTFCGITVGSPAEKIAEAKLRIHLVALNESSEDNRATREARRPLAIVGFEEGMVGDPDVANADYFRHEGPLTVLFEQVVSEANRASDADAILTFTNEIGAIVEEMESKNGRDGFLKITRWMQSSGPGRMPGEDIEKGQLDLVAMAFRFSWGEV